MTQLICPITLTEISEYGITEYGSIYEFNAIIQWLEFSDTDPLLNKKLQNNFVHKFIGNADDAQVFANKIAHQSKTTDIIYDMTIPKHYVNYSNYKNNVETLKNDNMWNNYCNDKRIQFQNGFSYAYPPDMINNDNRIENTGKNYDFMDLSKITVTSKNFKSETFNFANMSNCNFINCDFSRCEFMETNLNFVNFINCKFIGEQVIFHKATTMKTMFKNCEFEYTNKWVITNNVEEIKLILKNRLLDQINLDMTIIL